jgi:hypothetical protein
MRKTFADKETQQLFVSGKSKRLQLAKRHVLQKRVGVSFDHPS